MKLVMSESAQNSAVTAMRRVDQPEPAVVECVLCVLCVEVAMCGLRFFHPDCNRWSWNPTRSTAYSRVADFGLRAGDCSPAPPLPPVGNLTPP